MSRDQLQRLTGFPSTQDSQLQAGTDQNGVSDSSVSSPFEPAAVMSGSVIGTDLTILGEKITIISQKSLQIDGDIRGNVSGKKVTIGPDGSVIGTVSAESVEIHGGVRGTVRAMSVKLDPRAQVDGEILHQTLVISEGAQFQGSVRRPKNVAELTPNLDTNPKQPLNPQMPVNPQTPVKSQTVKSAVGSSVKKPGTG